MIKIVELCLYYVLHVLSLNLQFTAAFRNEKPIAEKIWREPCNPHSRVLNDCNWCRCSPQMRYTCDARVCSEIDVFGHFNDAIRDIDVGMEGHGVWRTTAPACQPGVHYQRGPLLCICDEEGNWPNPTCRDTFRVLYDVEVVDNVKTFKDEKCAPSKFYLIGCNVCFCPQDGIPNPRFCTRKSCSKNDPIFVQKEQKTEVGDIYATCNVSKKYKLGCKNCVCLRNNRLLCDNCTEPASQCSNKVPGEIFNVECNLCQCDEDGSMYCTVKRCLEGIVATPNYIDDSQYTMVQTPRDYINCVRGTKFKLGCKTCYCYQFEGITSPYCDTESCPGDDVIQSDCVEKTIYEKDCLLCHCTITNGKKMELCRKSPNCKKPGRSLPNLYDVQGYCEPLHIYRKDCNTCVCLTDGKTVKCTSHLCQKRDTSHSVEIVPVVKDLGSCPKGRSFKIDCNVCFCLSNGDVLCTTAKCRK